jgi:hypothetical protein
MIVWIIMLAGFLWIGHMLSTPEMREESRRRIQPYGRIAGTVALIVLALWILWPAPP